MAVESFADESRFKGTCYRACGFEAVGASAGFARDRRDYYTEHGQPKALYLRELRPGARKTLARPQLPAAPPSCEIAYYVTSRTREEMAPQQLLDAAIAHWEGVENGTHYVRASLSNRDSAPLLPKQMKEPCRSRARVS